MNLDINYYLSRNILIEIKDENGHPSFETNYRGIYWAIIGDAVYKEEKNPKPENTKWIRFESEPFILKEFTDSLLNSFLDRVKEQLLFNKDKFKNIHEIPNVLKFKL